MPFVPMVPTETLLLLQEPPAVASVKLVVRLRHTFLLPEIFAGSGLTVEITVVIQPVGSV